MNPIYSNLLADKNVGSMVAEAKNKKVIDKGQVVDIENLFLLMLTARADLNSALFNLPLDIIAEILNNGVSIEEKMSLREWFKPTQSLCKYATSFFTACSSSKPSVKATLELETPQAISNSLQEALLKNRNFFESAESSEEW